MEKWTKEVIKENIKTNDRWLYRAILAIYARQELSEKRNRETQVSNGVGFNALDAELLSSFAEYLQRNKKLTDKQKTIARNKMLKYSGQLAKIANGEI